MNHFIRQLVQDIKRPKPYTASTAPFWEDVHISKGMLEAHLNPTTSAATRLLPFVDQSISWIHSLFPSKLYPELLDLGCGPGLYAERFNNVGFKVTGVDISQRSIEYATTQAKVKNLPILYINANYVDMTFNRKFDIITLIYCDYSALNKQNRINLLKKIRQWH